MGATYTKTSPWYKTQITVSGELDLLSIRPVPAEDDDYLYEIEPQFNHRPDLLAHVVYGTSKLWWVFTQRNMNIIRDPIFDFTSGTKIYVPKSSAVKRILQL